MKIWCRRAGLLYILGPARTFPAAKMGIRHQQNVHDSVGALRGFDGFLQARLATFVLRVGDNHDGLAPGLRVQLFIAGEIDGIVKRCARDLPGTARPWIAGDASTRWDVDARLVYRAVELAAIVGEIR